MLRLKLKFNALARYDTFNGIDLELLLQGFDGYLDYFRTFSVYYTLFLLKIALTHTTDDQYEQFSLKVSP